MLYDFTGLLLVIKITNPCLPMKERIMFKGISKNKK